MSLDYLNCFAVVLRVKRDTQEHFLYARLVIILTPNLEFCPYSEVIHGSTTFKLTKS